MKKTLQLLVKEKEVTIAIFDGDNYFDEESWIDENNLLEKFFPIMDGMLKKNNMSIDNIDSFELVTNIPAGYTTARIAETIIKTLNFAHT